jgi:hypothetical protein
MTLHELFATIVPGLLGCSAIACGAYLRWGWRQQRRVMARQASEPSVPPPPPLLSFRHLALPSASVDAATEIRDVLTMVDGEAACHGVRLEMAVAPDLWLRTNPVSLRALLVELVRHAIRHTPNGKVLVSAAPLGGRVQIAVMDDGIAEPEAVRQAALREVAQVAALQGGTLEIACMHDQGCVVTVRLPAPAEMAVCANVPAAQGTPKGMAEGTAEGTAQGTPKGTAKGNAESDTILEWEI